MADEEKQLDEQVGEMHKQREPMADGQRYIIYYTFGIETAEKGENAKGDEVSENV